MSADSTGPVERSPAGWALYGLAAFVACGVIGLVLDWFLDARLQPYRWGPDAMTPLQQLRGEKLAEGMRQIRVTGMQMGAVVLGAIAGTLALALCLVDAVRLRQTASFVMSPLGAILGAIGGALGGFLATYIHLRFVDASGLVATMTETILLQSAGWACAGLGIALGVWVASAGRRPFVVTLIGGILAGAAVGVVYPPIVGLLFPNENTDRLFPEDGLFPASGSKGDSTSAFLFWVLFTGVVFALILGGVAKRVSDSKSDVPASAANV